MTDPINPDHYRSHPSGVECITISEHFTSNIGQAIQYLWRHELANGIQDLKKAEWFVRREIERLQDIKEKRDLAAETIAILRNNENIPDLRAEMVASSSEVVKTTNQIDRDTYFNRKDLP